MGSEVEGGDECMEEEQQPNQAELAQDRPIARPELARPMTAPELVVASTEDHGTCFEADPEAGHSDQHHCSTNAS